MSIKTMNEVLAPLDDREKALVTGALSQFMNQVGFTEKHDDPGWKAKVMEYRSELPDNIQNAFLDLIGGYLVHGVEFAKVSPIQLKDLLQNLKQKAAVYADNKGNNDEMYKPYADAAQALYDAISKVVNAGKTVVLQGEAYFSERQEIRTMGMGHDIDWLKFSSNRNDQYTLQGCCMTGADSVEVIDD